MSSDDQFTALGSSGGTAVGFQTHGTHIERGVDVQGNALGVRGTGPIGVRGTGRPGPGGVFDAGALTAQVRLTPHPESLPGKRVTITASEFEGLELALPVHADPGDLMVTQHPGATAEGEVSHCALWLCVAAPQGHAHWAQVLLGKTVPGAATTL